ncbi:MAG: hypothetical protein M1840_001423 [Geoglossum simile]|nr:MAG: hypothetical protein M1840_001423 [Geoglossum simile]
MLSAWWDKFDNSDSDPFLIPENTRVRDARGASGSNWDSEQLKAFRVRRTKGERFPEQFGRHWVAAEKHVCQETRLGDELHLYSGRNELKKLSGPEIQREARDLGTFYVGLVDLLINTASDDLGCATTTTQPQLRPRNELKTPEYRGTQRVGGVSRRTPKGAAGADEGEDEDEDEDGDGDEDTDSTFQSPSTGISSRSEHYARTKYEPVTVSMVLNFLDTVTNLARETPFQADSWLQWTSNPTTFSSETGGYCWTSINDGSLVRRTREGGRKGGELREFGDPVCGIEGKNNYGGWSEGGKDMLPVPVIAQYASQMIGMLLRLSPDRDGE